MKNFRMTIYRCTNLSLLIVVVMALDVSAQPYTNLVFEGAGIRGVAYVGAIKALEEKNLLKKIEKVGGTSAGAIAALAVSLGYSSADIEQLIYNTKLQKFNDGKGLFVGGMSRLDRNYGWYSGTTFTKWLEAIIEAKTDDPNVTFMGLHKMKFKDLYVTGTSLNNQRVVVFSYETYPNMRVKDAVRISMSIPLYFEAVFIDSAGQIIKKKKHLPEYYDVMVDGGFTVNFPIALFDSASHSGSRAANFSTIGLRIDAPDQIIYDASKKGLAPVPVNRLRNYVGAFYIYVIENLNRSTLTDDDWRRTVSISSGTIGPKIRKLSPEEKNELITNGYEAMLKFLH